ncbi:MAG TPA: metalloregulator ArsR/SmtB family transcription factor [Candidatus Limnocylindria bacterium]|jgi:DNA-binding transcriptional ArsR family regulator|nr:metalloregulator ArsR/SmtB family transcription factor [Candidatus Limnocylindria bacterium]
MSIKRCCTPPPADAVDRTHEIELLRAIADPHRAAALSVLARAGCPVCVCDFTELLGVSQPTVSHHLRVLRDAGLLRVNRRGTWAYYELAADARERIKRAVDVFFPQGAHA